MLPHAPRRVLAAVLAALLCLWAAWHHGEASRHAASAQAPEAPRALRWYKGNIHTHSLWSDGDDYPEMIALWYKERGYHFLCFTDHNVLHNVQRWTDPAKNKGGVKAYDKLRQRFALDWIEQRGSGDRLEVRLKTFEEVSRRLAVPDQFLLIQGEEISDRFGNLPIHLNATNLRELIPPMRGQSVLETIQNNVDAVMAQRERTGQPILVHLNHPNFGHAVTAEDLMRVRGENFFEVYNGHPGVHNSGDETHASAERVWDIILTRRLAEFGLPLMYGLATDDGHNYHNIPSRASEPGRGWVMVLAEALTPEALISAMEAGRFYASSGVELAEVESTIDGLRVAVAPEAGVSYTIEFIGTRHGFDAGHAPVVDSQGKEIRATRRYSDDVGAVLSRTVGETAEYRFTGEELYVRARVTSSKRHPNPSEPGEFERAWVQPVRGPAAPAAISDR